MAQTTANVVGSVCQTSNRNMDTSEGVIAACEEGDGSAHRASAPDRDVEDIGRPPSTSSDLMTNKAWRTTAKKMHRMVEQIDQEPLGIVIFKWCLILIGSIMLGVVLFLTGEVIYLWSSGDLKKEQELALAILEENLAANETMVSTSTETFLDQ